ncbi:hypothetical protein, partial [Bacillus mobilis]|uniref:hypothetical protein n=1 Tax=Bacillus mobilis TaxID=2026190 RepID=UPI0039EE6357
MKENEYEGIKKNKDYLLEADKKFKTQKKTSHTDSSYSCLATSYSHRDKVPTTIGARELNFRVRYG